MPYIKTELRDRLEGELGQLSDKIDRVADQEESRDKALPGLFNYAITVLINKVYGRKLRYADYNAIVGMLECCKQEFYRRAVAAYEDECIGKNGDVF